MANQIKYRRHLIKTLRQPAEVQARAFRGGKPVGAVFNGPTLDAAVIAVKDFLDERARAFRALRLPSGFPCATEVREALSCVPMNKAQEAMLQAHLNAPSHILTATELSQAAGYDDYTVANRQYGQLAYDVAQELEWTPTEQTNGVTIWTFTLAEDADLETRQSGGDVQGHWRWRLRPEVVEALLGG